MNNLLLSLDKFIEGENLNLLIPTKKFILNSYWHKILNSSRNTQYLDHGLFPNTIDDQVKFLLSSKKEGRIVLIIENNLNFCGVISLSSINFEKLQCDISLVLNNDISLGKTSRNPLVALEAIAILTQHAFDKLGLNRISAGQCIDLLKWQNFMELCGYVLEGISREKFKKGLKKYDVLNIACLKKDFLYLKSRRNGKLWDSRESMMKRIKLMPKENFYDKFFTKIKEDHKYYYNSIFNL